MSKVIKIAHLSDTHSFHEQVKLEPCDILIHSGDITNRGEKSQVESFLKWFSKQDVENKIFISGNHDLNFDRTFDWETNAHHWLNQLLDEYKINYGEPNSILEDTGHPIYLENNSIWIEGLKIWGSPATPWFYDWAFNYQRGQEINEIWKEIPRNTDIVVTHGPVMYKCDYIPPQNKFVGCADLAYHIAEIKPKLHLSGHIHCGYGRDEDIHTIYLNSSVCNEQYKVTNAPQYIDLLV